MAFTTESNYTGDGSNKDFIITFPFLASGDVKVRTRPSGGSWTTHTVTDDYSIAGTTLTFVTAPVDGADVQIFRDTDIDKTKITFQTGASIRAQDLNNISKQFLYAAQEFEQASTTPSGTGLALTASTKNHITVNSANDWTIGSDVVANSMLADNSVDSDQYVDGSIDTIHIGDDQVTYAKIQNVSATDRILGRDSAGAGIVEEITPANVRTMINVADGANAYVHPNHSGEVTSTADGATVIADNIVDEANLKISNAGTNGDYLTKQSGNTGGLTWLTPASTSATKYASLSDVKSSNTSGGNYGTANTWVTRDLNTENDPDGIVALNTPSTNDFQLGRGRYLITFRVPGFNIQNFRGRLYDVTNSAEVALGDSQYANEGGWETPFYSTGFAAVNLTGNTAYRLEMIANATDSNGLGRACNVSSVNEVYSQVSIIKSDNPA